MSLGDSAIESTTLQKAIALALDHLVALANLRLERVAVQYLDESARMRITPSSGSFRSVSLSRQLDARRACSQSVPESF